MMETPHLLIVVQSDESGQQIDGLLQPQDNATQLNSTFSRQVVAAAEPLPAPPHAHTLILYELPGANPAHAIANLPAPVVALRPPTVDVAEETAVLAAGAAACLPLAKLTPHWLQHTIHQLLVQAQNTSLPSGDTAAAAPFLESEERHETDLGALNDILRTALAETSITSMLDALVDQLVSLFKATGCHITLFDENSMTTIPAAAAGPFAESFLNLGAIDAEQTITYAVLEMGQVLGEETPRQSPYLNPTLAGRIPEDYSLLTLPLMTDTRKLGAVILIFTGGHTFSRKEIAQGQQVAGLLSLAIGMNESLATERQQRELAQTLQQIARFLNQTLNQERILKLILDYLAGMIAYDSASVMLLQDNIQLKNVAYRSIHHHENGGQVSFKQLDYMRLDHIRAVIVEKTPIIIRDTAVDSRWVKLASTPKIRSWLGVPLMAQGRVLGLLNMSKSQPDFFTEQHAEVCQNLAEHAVVAIENARLYGATRRQLEELKILHALAEAGSAALSEDEYIAHATAVIHENLHPFHFGILMFDQDTNTLHPHKSYRFHNPKQALRDPISTAQGVAGEVLRTGQPRLINNVTTISHYLPAEKGMNAEICVPLRVNNRIIGVINAEHPEPGHYSEADLRLLITLAGQAATTIEKTRLLTAERARREEAEQLREATNALTSSLEIDKVLNAILTQLQKVVHYDSAAVFLEENDWLKIVAGKGFPRPEIIINQYYSKDNRLFRELKEKKQPIYLKNASENPDFKAWGETGYTRGWLGVPLIVRDEMIGYITLDSRTVGAYRESDANLALAFANQAAAAIANARSFANEQRARQVAETIRAANMALSRNLDLQAIMKTLLAHMQRLIAYTSASIYLIDEKNQAKLVAGCGYPSEDMSFAVFSLDDTEDNTFARIYHTQKSLIIDDVKQWPNIEIFPETAYIRSWAGIPLHVHGRIIGFFSLDHETPGFFNEHNLQPLEPLVTHAGFVIQNAKLYESVTTQAKELQVVSDILTRLNSTISASEIFPDLHGLLAGIVDCDWTTIVLLEPDGQHGRMFPRSDSADNLVSGIRIDIAQTAAYDDLIQGKIHVTPDLAAEQTLTNDAYLYQIGIRSRLNLPLLVGDTVIGSLNLGWRQPGRSARAPLSLLKQISQALALGIDRSRLFDKVSHRAHQLAMLHNLSKRIAGALDSRVLADMVTTELCTNFRYESAAIMLLDTAVDQLFTLSVAGPNTPSPPNRRLSTDTGLIGETMRDGKVAIANGTAVSTKEAAGSPTAVQAEVALPLKSGDHVFGVLHIHSTHAHNIDENDVAILTIVADQVATALEKTRLFEETQQRATELSILADISAALREAVTIADITAIILEKTAQITPVDQASLALYQPQTDTWELRRFYPNDDKLPIWEDVIANHAGGAFATIPHMFAPVDSHEPIRKVDLLSQERVIGIVLVALKAEAVITDQNRRLFTAVSAIAGNALDRALVLETLEERVHTRTRDLAEANERLQELDRLKSKFVSEVSHELRTPVTNLSLYLDLLAKGSEERRDHYTAVLNRQVERLHQLIADILNLSRLDLGHDAIAMTPVALNDVVLPILVAHEPRFDIIKVELQMELASDLPLIWGEPNQIAQVVVNLLANSINYTPEGWVRVSTFFDQDRQHVALQIADSGIGISAQDQSHLFDRFYRGQNVSQLNIPGTGLGLAIVQEIVKLHKGKIEVESLEDQGTTFTIWLPLSETNDR